MAASSESSPPEEMQLEEHTPGLEGCSCSACSRHFQGQSIVETATQVVDHWNDEHANILTNSFTAFTTEQVETQAVSESVHQIREKRVFLTVYDVITPDGDEVLDKAFVEEFEYQEICVGCNTSIYELDGVEFEELPSEQPYQRYLCDGCAKQRELERRRRNNKQLGEWAVDNE